MFEWKKWPIKIIKIDDNEYPENLKRIKSCPKILYYRGNWNNELFGKTLAIVGSRRMTRYGREILTKFMPDIVANKITIISGFVYGIDSEAHRLCMELGGKTIAVLGGGLDFLSPTENDQLYCDILKSGGLVISEYEADFMPTLWSFPQRNRIVAALSTEGILVVEAGLKSGSLITARLGKKQGKTIYAIPGPITAGTSQGTNWLIKSENAKMVTEINDLLTGDEITKAIQINLFDNLDEMEKEILSFLKNEELSIDELSRKTNKTIAEITTKITLMSMRGLVEEEGGKVYLA
jgi:DNA processing protein